MTPTISSCSIVKNEERNIEGLIDDCALFADEIVIVDTGSSDRTIELIEKKATTLSIPIIFKVYKEEPFHYGKAKNVALRAATKDYCVIMDADFRVGPGFVDGLRPFLEEHEPELATEHIVDEYVPSLVVTPVFITKRSAGHFFREDDERRVHEEFVNVHTSSVIDFPGVLYHCQRSDHSLIEPQRILFQLRIEIDKEPRTASFFWHCLRGVRGFWFKFDQYYFKRHCWRDGWAGFKYCFIKGLSEFLKQVFVGLKARPKDIEKLNARSPLNQNK